LTDLKAIYGAGQVVVLVNSLGAVTNLEMTLITNEVLDWFKNAGDEVVRIITGGVMTSLDMNGISLTVLKVSDLADKDDVLKWLDL
jgi:dihydroxyacetone kinase